MKTHGKQGNFVVLFLAAATLTSACGRVEKKTTSVDGSLDALPQGEDLSLSMGLQTYANCQEIKDVHARFLAVRRANQEAWQRQMDRRNSSRGPVTRGPSWANGAFEPGRPSDAATTTASDDAAMPQKAQADTARDVTNVQDKNVDESDSVKTSKDQMFYVTGQRVAIVERKDFSVTGYLDLGSSGAELFIKDDRLLVIRSSNQNVEMANYQLVAGAVPRPIGHKTIQGQLNTSRVVDGQIYVVANFSASFPDLQSNAPMIQTGVYRDDSAGYSSPSITISGDSLSGVPCNRILKNHVTDGDQSYTKIVSVKWDDGLSETDSLAAQGSSPVLYASESRIVLSKIGVNWTPMHWTTDDGASATVSSSDVNLQQTSMVTTIALQAGKLTPSAFALIPGSIKDRWSIGEIGQDRLLAFATTGGINVDQTPDSGSKGEGNNHLIIVREKDGAFETVGRVTHFGKAGEQLKSIRFVDDYAYAVTFRQTDPLYAINLASPAQPKISAELEIPGFSSYLHPVKDGLLLGVGYAADRNKTQISLFQHDGASVLTQIDNVALGQYGSSSEAQLDSHMFWYGEEKQWFSLPVWIQGGKEFRGAMLFAIENKKLVEKARVSHQDMVASFAKNACNTSGLVSTPVRSFELDGKFVTLSVLGMRVFDEANYAKPIVDTTFTAVLNPFCTSVTRVIE